MIQFSLSSSLNGSFQVPQVDGELIIRAAEETLTYASSVEEADLTLLLTDDAQMRELNKVYRHVDDTTDVLAFPSGDMEPDSGRIYLGDVLISLPRAIAQALDGGHELKAELQLLVVHGVLHLLGYDHAEDEERAAMWKVQAEVLSAIGCSISAPSY